MIATDILRFFTQANWAFCWWLPDISPALLYPRFAPATKSHATHATQAFCSFEKKNINNRKKLTFTVPPTAKGIVPCSMSTRGVCNLHSFLSRFGLILWGYLFVKFFHFLPNTSNHLEFIRNSFNLLSCTATFLLVLFFKKWNECPTMCQLSSPNGLQIQLQLLLLVLLAKYLRHWALRSDWWMIAVKCPHCSNSVLRRWCFFVLPVPFREHNVERNKNAKKKTK